MHCHTKFTRPSLNCHGAFLSFTQENAGPPQVFLTPTGGGLGLALPWGLLSDMEERPCSTTNKRVRWTGALSTTRRA
ncbi:protein of unknown function [Thiomonas sp. CB2]|nr:protein of unknown function [Thiomonas sp. CB2]